MSKRKPRYRKYPTPGFEFICGLCGITCSVIRYYNGPIFGYEYRTKCCLSYDYKQEQRINL